MYANGFQTLGMRFYMRWIERIEYGLILALIAIVVIGILTLLISNLGG